MPYSLLSTIKIVANLIRPCGIVTILDLENITLIDDPVLNQNWEHRSSLKKKRREKKKKKKAIQLSIVNYLQNTLMNIYFILVHFILSSAITAVGFREIEKRKILKKFCPVTASAN